MRGIQPHMQAGRVEDIVDSGGSPAAAGSPALRIRRWPQKWGQVPRIRQVVGLLGLSVSCLHAPPYRMPPVLPCMSCISYGLPQKFQ